MRYTHYQFLNNSNNTNDDTIIATSVFFMIIALILMCAACLGIINSFYRQPRITQAADWHAARSGRHEKADM
ncbi:MAG: hypothetical protein RQM95_12080 [Syntrophaceticus schinkii]